MNLNEYQEKAVATAIYPQEYAIIYPALKLSGEAGEVSEKIGKALRDRGGQMPEAFRLELAKELGDVLWYIAAMARDLGLDLETIARMNVEKLADRQKRGVLGGSGDNR